MKRVLVTGAGGQLGMTLQEMAKYYAGIIFDFRTSQKLNITRRDILASLFDENNYDFCINCAAYTNVEQAEKTPEKAFSVNAEGVKNLAEICKQKEIILVHISTDYVFDGKKQEPYHPDDIPNPINEYGKSKWKGEQYIQDISRQFYIVRTSWLYSKKYGKNFYRTVLKKAEDGDTLKITDSQIGCPTATDALAKYLIENIINNQPAYGIYHFCDEKAMSWYDFAKMILKDNNYTDKTIVLKKDDTVSSLKRPNYSILKKSG